MPEGANITGEVEGGKKGRCKEGGWIVPQHTTSVISVSLSIESPMRHQGNYTSHQNRPFIVFFCLYVFSFMLVLTA